MGFLNEKLSWSGLSQPLINHKINAFEPLMQRIEQSQINSMLTANNALVTAHLDQHKKVSEHMTLEAKFEPAPIEKIAAEINFDDFIKVDLRVALITKAGYVEGADRLLRLTISIGSETRSILSGIRSCYEPKDLEGRLTVIVANLAPRKMRFGVSEGMVLAAGDNDGIYLLSPDSGAKPGQRIT